MDFVDAFNFVVGSEGGYSDDPLDNGNWTGGKQNSGELLGTKYGIAANTYGIALKKQGKSIKDLTLADAMRIYRHDWWDKMRCDELPSKYRLPLFSAAINCGMGVAVKWLQECVGEKADGVIGPKTIRAARACNAEWSLNGFYERWLARYDKIVERNLSQKKYLKGWRARVEHVKAVNG